MRAKPKIFISYAKEDVDIAKRLYHDLKNKGLSPWLDLKIGLPPISPRHVRELTQITE